MQYLTGFMKNITFKKKTSLPFLKIYKQTCVFTTQLLLSHPHILTHPHTSKIQCGYLKMTTLSHYLCTFSSSQPTNWSHFQHCAPFTHTNPPPTPPGLLPVQHIQTTCVTELTLSTTFVFEYEQTICWSISKIIKFRSRGHFAKILVYGLE